MGKYEESLERAKSKLPEYKEVIEYIFPDLKKEDKDEEIIKELIQYFDDWECITGTEYFGNLKVDSILAWLEKQRPISRDTEKRDLWEYVEEFKEKFGHLPKDTDEVVVCTNYILKRLKPNEKWSEEDEKTVHLACEFIRHHSNPIDSIGGIDCSTLIERLKSLKNRVGCEANFITTKEWSEEDEQYLLVCKNALAKYQTTDKWDSGIISRWIEDKLKSLRPQSQWKPSERDLGSLTDAIIHYEGIGIKPNGLKELFEQLKKLREE